MKMNEKVVNAQLNALAKIKQPLKAVNTLEAPNYAELALKSDKGVVKLKKHAISKVQNELRDGIGYGNNKEIYAAIRVANSKAERLALGENILVRSEGKTDKWISILRARGTKKLEKDIRTTLGRQLGGLESILIKAEVGHVALTEEQKDRIQDLMRFI